MAKNITVYFADGSSHIYQGVPDGVTPDQAVARAQSDFSGKKVRHVSREDTSEEEVAPTAEPKRPGFFGGLKMGAEQLLSSGRTALGTVTGSPEEAAQAGLARQEEISKKYGEGLSLDKLQEIYESEGIFPAAKEFVSEIPGAIGAQIPNIGAAIAGARLGARVPGTPIVKGIGAIAGAAVPSLFQQYGGDVERQAAEQQARNEQIAIDRGRALTAAVPQAALDVAGETIPLGRSLVGKLFGESVQRLLGAGEKEAAEQLAKESLKATLAKGTLTGVLAEVPTEVAQQALERWNAGLSLTDTDAMKEYGDTALQVAMLGPLGAVGRLSERSAARGVVADEAARRAAEEQAQQPPETPPETVAQGAPEAAPVTPPTPEETSEQAARRARAEDDFRNMVLSGLQGKPTVDEFQRLTGLTRGAARAEMDRMVDSGFLQKDEKTGRYSLVPEFAQFQFTNAGEAPRATLNAYPVEETPAAPTVPGVAPGQMDLFEEQARKDAAQQAADKQREDNARVLKALKQNMSIETIQNELGLPYPQARNYMMSLRDAGVVEFKSGKWQFVPEFAQYKLPFYEGAPSKYSMVEYPTAETAAPIQPGVPEGQGAFDFEAPVATKAPEAGKGSVFDEDTLNKAMEAVRANGRATIPVIQKATGVSRTDALAFMSDLRDRGITNKKNEIITEGPKDGGETGVPSGTRQRRDRTSPKVSVPKGGTGTGEPAGTERTGLGGADRTVGTPVGGEGASEAALIVRKRLDLPSKPGIAMPPESKVIVDRTVRAVQNGAMNLDDLRQIKDGLKAPIPDYPFLHALIDNATRPVNLSLVAKTGEGLEFESLLPKARMRVIRNMYKRKQAEAAKAERPKRKTRTKAAAEDFAEQERVRTERDTENARSEYASRAIDALADDKISEKTYENIREALKEAAPNFAKIDDMLAGKARGRRAATEESAARGVEAGRERKTRKRSAAADMEDAADALLRGAGYDEEGNLKFQSTPRWYYSQLSRTIDALPEKAFGSPEQVLNTITNKPGVKKDELEAVGLFEHLAGLKGVKLSTSELKKNIQEFLAKGGFHLEEVEEGRGASPDYSPETEMELEDNVNDASAQLDAAKIKLEDTTRRIELIWESKIFPDVESFITDKLGLDTSRYRHNLKLVVNDVLQMREFHNIEDFTRDMLAQLGRVLVSAGFPESEQNRFDDYFDDRMNSDTEYLEATNEANMAAEELQLIEEDFHDAVREHHQFVNNLARYSGFIQPESDRGTYRNFLLRNPASTYVFTHFREPGVIAHIRTTDYETVDGVSGLRVEEIQSDWEKFLRDEAWATSLLKRKENTDPKEWKKWLRTSEGVAAKQKYDTHVALAGRIEEASGQDPRKITAGPFVKDSKSYTTLALKKILSQAAQEGKQQIEFVRGEESQKVVGGKLEGQKKFYNEFLPELVRALVFREGLDKVGVTVVPPGRESGRLTINLTPEALEKINRDRFALFKRGTEAGTVSHEAVVKAVKDATAGWRNPPKVSVVRNTTELPENIRGVPGDVRGFYSPTTKTVYVISSNAPSIEGARATVFHESLGHYGLDKKFRGDLDIALGKMYENPEMKRAADAWLKANPDTYAHLAESKQIARAVEEVLAERSEAGPIKEAGLRGLFNRLIAFVRDWARRHGFGTKYSDNDITQILRQAHDIVIGREESALDYSFDPQLRYQLTPDEQRKQDSTLIRSYATAEDRKPNITKEAIARGRDSFSKLTPTMRRGLFSTMNQNQLANEFESVIPGLRTRYDLLNQKGSYLRTQLDHIADTVKEAHDVFQKYPYSQRQRMFDIFHKTTLDQIEVLDDPKREWVADKTNPVYTQFKALPKEVQDVYRKMRETYDNQARVTLGFLYSITEPSQRKEFEKKLKNQRLKVYLPLFRTGDNWMSYTTKDGEFVKRSFETLAERDQAYREAKQAGYKDITRYNNNNHASHGAPPSAFFGRVMAALKDSGADETTINSVVESYLDLMPAKSILQMARKREGTAGYVRDVVQSFSNVATRSAAHITNLKYNHELEKVMDTIREEASKAALLHETDPADKKGMNPDVKNDLMAVIEKSHSYMLNPNYSRATNAVQQFNYITYLGGNVSTAFVTLMHMPTVAYPTLARISGFFSAASAMKRMHSYAMDYQFGGGKKLPADLKRVLEQAHKDGVIGERRAQDIAEFKTSGTDRYLGYKARVDKVLNATLGAADKYNRELTLLASYDLNREKLKKTGLSGDALHAAAYDAAKRDVYDTLGSVFNTAAANVLQVPLGRMFLTFKQDAMHRAYLLSKAFWNSVKGESKEVRTAARKQVLGFYVMAGLLAGVKGMPLVGWGEMLAQLLHPDDDDEAYDASEEVKEAVGLLPYKGLINYFLNLHATDRIGWDGMFWRDDPVRRSQLGFMNFAAEKLFGPVATYAGQNLPRVYDHIQNGRLELAMESFMPVAAANVLKGIRYGLDGATTKDGVPIKKDVNAYNAFMQVLGFSPADLAEIQEENSSRIGLEKKIYNTKDALLAQFVAAKVNNDEEGLKEVLQKIRKFGARYPGVAISNADLSGAVTKHHKRLTQSVNGVYMNPKLRQQIMAARPSMVEEDEDEEEE